MKFYVLKGPDNLNIKEICTEIPVARTTFYSHYQNLSEIKEEIQNDLINGILEISDDETLKRIEDDKLPEYFEKIFSYIKANWETIYAFLITYPDISFMEKWKSAIKKHLALRYPQKTKISGYGIISEVIASAVLSAYIYWMKNPDEVDASKISKIAVNALLSLKELI